MTSAPPLPEAFGNYALGISSKWSRRGHQLVAPRPPAGRGWAPYSPVWSPTAPGGHCIAGIAARYRREAVAP